jgi:hypothetical protein
MVDRLAVVGRPVDGFRKSRPSAMVARALLFER